MRLIKQLRDVWLSSELQSFETVEQQLAKHGMTLHIARKSVKNINFRVKRQQLHVSAPQRIGTSALLSAIEARLDWAIHANQQLKHKQDQFVDIQHTLLVDGCTVMLWGNEYVLKLMTAKKTRIERDDDNRQIVLYGANQMHEALLSSLVAFYRLQLQSVMPELFAKWQPVVGKAASETRIKKMSTRWGSCNVRDKRVWLSLYLAQYPIECTEYVIVHELCHLYEANHSKRFWQHVARSMPNYKRWHDCLKGKAV